MKRWILVIGLTWVYGVSAQTINHEPMFGGEKKPLSQVKADKEFIDKMEAREGGRKKAAEYFIEKGWYYYHRDVLDTAMFRFNQAFLLDPENPEVYFGFGCLMGRENKPHKSIELFSLGLKKDENNQALKFSLATSYMDHAMRDYVSQNNRNRMLFTSNRLLNEVYEADPSNSEVLYRLAINAFLRGDYIKSWKYIENCKALDGSYIMPDFIFELSSRHSDPTGLFKNDYLYEVH